MTKGVVELTLSELLVVSGGWDTSREQDFDTITVSAPWPDVPDYVYGYDPYAGWDQADYSGGGGGGDGIVSWDFGVSGEALEQQVDLHAKQIADAIRQMPDHTSREYVSFIYKDVDGTIKHTAIVAGQATSVSFWETMGAANLVPNQIFGVIHNHPEDSIRANPANDPRYIEEAVLLNRLPSDSDWDRANEAFQDRSDVALYVLGPDSILREYENSDSRMWDDRNELTYYQQNGLRVGGAVD